MKDEIDKRNVEMFLTLSLCLTYCVTTFISKMSDQCFLTILNVYQQS